MHHFKYWILLLLLTLALVSGCANNPLGMSDDEWHLLTPEQQFEARKIQDERDEAARVRRAEQQAQEAAAQAKLIELRRTAPYGDVIQCSITQAKGLFAKNEWHPLLPISIEMHHSEAARKLDLMRQDQTSSNITLKLEFDGLNVKVCRSNNRDCDVMAGTAAQFKRGISRHIKVKNAVDGTLFCSFPLRR
ncbi:hypothetical protein [Rheinheimera sp. MMS21-TC3]|uniref:hypothetical protein n=1 Tax=Rheinheimera sp. MMS21-TC3 TaxID=3072790 RepID=UPI0028C450CE|nr:hypothetical protein [Rheinheimera sp. MMS21-TC3]WNO61344.1 hypothetical protein RDV63_10395 [Rheinheimera sp. MMS21-TC3]